MERPRLGRIPGRRHGLLQPEPSAIPLVGKTQTRSSVRSWFQAAAATRPRFARPRFDRVLPILCLLAACTAGLGLILTKPFPSAFDELEHVSYAAFLQETGRLLPHFDVQRTLSRESMAVWDDRANYLGHPSPFYLLESLLLDRTLPPDRAVLPLRLASGGLVLAGLVAALWAGHRVFSRDIAALGVFCLALAFCPKLLAVSGQVTNDTLGFMGGAFAYAGATMTGRRNWPALGAVAGGLILAMWSKPNAGLAIGAWLGIAALLQSSYRRELLAALAGGVVIGSVPYWLIILDYGKLVPVTVEQFGQVRQLADFASYWPAFLLTIGYTWSFSQTGTWPMPDVSSIVASGLFWVMMGCAAFGGMLARGRGWAPRDAIAIAAPIAFALVLLVHLWFSATKLAHSLPAASFRYYLPLWPALVHALAYATGSARLPWQRIGVAAATLSALAAGWIIP